MNKMRIRKLNNYDLNSSGSCVIYWMSRDQRVQDNWALAYAQELAENQNVPLLVVFVLSRQFLGATLRQYDFMLRGLDELFSRLEDLNIPFYLLHEDKKVPEIILNFIDKVQPCEIVTDFSPLRVGRQWRDFVAKECKIALSEVDAHNIVPAWVISDHQEFAAHTIRPKLHSRIDDFLEDFPEVRFQKLSFDLKPEEWDVKNILDKLEINREVLPVKNITAGESAGHLVLSEFLDTKMHHYGTLRNDPSEDMQSNLSPYLHYGQISAQRIVIETIVKTGKRLRAKLAEATDSAEAFLEELIVRRELADNFCLYNNNYDNIEGAPEWAQKSLALHKADEREFVYSLEQLEQAQTHDEIWNASQKEMRKTGKIHGYMRMYWAKKILEWTQSPEQAIEYAIYLNDKYELDGRDPNGYVGIMWSMCGVHDRPWFERPVFGQIRYMNAEGLKRKFDVAKYVSVNV